MDAYESLSHSVFECKYHVVFIPKYRRKVLYGSLRPHLGKVFRQLAQQKECRVEEGHLMPDHVHMLLSIPPKYAVSQVLYERKKRDPPCSDVCRAQTELCRAALLGTRLLRLDRWAG